MPPVACKPLTQNLCTERATEVMAAPPKKAPATRLMKLKLKMREGQAACCIAPRTHTHRQNLCTARATAVMAAPPKEARPDSAAQSTNALIRGP